MQVFHILVQNLQEVEQRAPHNIFSHFSFETCMINYENWINMVGAKSAIQKKTTVSKILWIF